MIAAPPASNRARSRTPGRCFSQSPSHVEVKGKGKENGCHGIPSSSSAGEYIADDEDHFDGEYPIWINKLQHELEEGLTKGDTHDDLEDRCEHPSCAPPLLTAGGYNRHHYEGEVRMHVRASLYA